MPHKDKAAGRNYARDYMRRRRAESAQPHGESPPIMPADKSNLNSQPALLAAAQAQTPAAAINQDKEPTKPAKKAEKCFWSDMNVCVLYLTPDGKPMYCDGIHKVCDGELKNIKSLPFGPGWKGFRKEP